MSRIIHKKSLRSPEVEIPPILLASREEGCLVVHEKGALQFTGREHSSLHFVWAQTRGAYPEHCNHTQIAFRLQISISKLSKMVWRLITNASKLFYFDPHRNAQWGGRRKVRRVIARFFLLHYRNMYSWTCFCIQGYGQPIWNTSCSSKLDNKVHLRRIKASGPLHTWIYSFYILMSCCHLNIKYSFWCLRKMVYTG